MLIMTQNMAQNSQAHLYTYGLCIKVAECNDYISHVDYGITRKRWVVTTIASSTPTTSSHSPLAPPHTLGVWRPSPEAFCQVGMARTRII